MTPAFVRLHSPAQPPWAAVKHPRDRLASRDTALPWHSDRAVAALYHDSYDVPELQNMRPGTTPHRVPAPLRLRGPRNPVLNQIARKPLPSLDWGLENSSGRCVGASGRTCYWAILDLLGEYGDAEMVAWVQPTPTLPRSRSMSRSPLPPLDPRSPEPTLTRLVVDDGYKEPVDPWKSPVPDTEELPAARPTYRYRQGWQSVEIEQVSEETAGRLCELVDQSALPKGDQSALALKKWKSVLEAIEAREEVTHHCCVHAEQWM